jgi:hypothetical protein
MNNITYPSNCFQQTKQEKSKEISQEIIFNHIRQFLKEKLNVVYIRQGKIGASLLTTDRDALYFKLPIFNNEFVIDENLYVEYYDDNDMTPDKVFDFKSNMQYHTVQFEGVYSC